MVYYIDFEALQYSEKIISIGCIAENGHTFSTLVCPNQKKIKITKLITQLTGITKEMLVNAPSVDDAFTSLSKFIDQNKDNTEDVFYCYGSSDATFLEKTLPSATTSRAQNVINFIRKRLQNYAPIVKQFFQCENDIALSKVFILMRAAAFEQRHDALEDAEILKEVVHNLTTCCIPEDRERLAQIPSNHIPRKRRDLAPAIYRSWSDCIADKMKANCLADSNNYTIKAYNAETNETIYFNSANTAALWIIKYFNRSVSPRKPEHVNPIETRIVQTAAAAKKYYGLEWTEKEIKECIMVL